jgi:hypothetical protein
MTSFFDKVLRDAGSAERKSARKPWWQTAKTSRQGFMLAATWAVLGLAALLIVVVGGGHIWVLAAGYLILAGVNLVTAVALRRREQSGANPDPGNRPPPDRMPGAGGPPG